MKTTTIDTVKQIQVQLNKLEEIAFQERAYRDDLKRIITYFNTLEKSSNSSILPPNAQDKMNQNKLNELLTHLKLLIEMHDQFLHIKKIYGQIPNKNKRSQHTSEAAAKEEVKKFESLEQTLQRKLNSSSCTMPQKVVAAFLGLLGAIIGAVIGAVAGVFIFQPSILGGPYALALASICGMVGGVYLGATEVYHMALHEMAKKAESSCGTFFSEARLNMLSEVQKPERETENAGDFSRSRATI